MIADHVNAIVQNEQVARLPQNRRIDPERAQDFPIEGDFEQVVVDRGQRIDFAVVVLDPGSIVIENIAPVTLVGKGTALPFIEGLIDLDQDILFTLGPIGQKVKGIRVSTVG